MATSYPTGLDTFTAIGATDEMNDEVGTRTHSEMHNDANDAIEAIEAELGTSPSGSYDTVAARLAASDPSALLVKANNLSDLASASSARTNLGLGTMATATATDYLTKAGNLAGLADLPTARTNLGLGTAAVANTGTGASNVILGNDARLTDTRTPTAHTHPQSDVTGLETALYKARVLAYPRSGEWTGAGAASLSSTIIGDGEVRATPMLLRSGTLDRIAAEVSIAGGLGSLVRLGLYKDNDGIPGDLLIDAGAVSAEVAAFKEIVVSVALPYSGRYWGVAVAQGGASPACALRTIGASGEQSSISGSAHYSLSLVNPAIARAASGITGALPDPANWTPGHVGPPRFAVRYA